MSTVAIISSLYGLLVILSWYPFWVILLKGEVRRYNHITGGDLLGYGLLAALCAVVWPGSWLFMGFRYLFQLISRTSKRKWWVPKSVRDKYY